MHERRGKHNEDALAVAKVQSAPMMEENYGGHVSNSSLLQ